MALLVTTSFEANARSKGEILVETVGVSTAVGLVVGASTLPFYQSPGSNLINLGIGAAAGLVVGLGIFAFEWLSGRLDKSLMADSNFGTNNTSSTSLLQPQTSSLQSSVIVYAPLLTVSW